jgi:hypothetical protein
MSRCDAHVVLEEALRVLVVGVVWVRAEDVGVARVPIERKMRRKETALADIIEESLPKPETMPLYAGSCSGKGRSYPLAFYPPPRARATYNFWLRPSPKAASRRCIAEIRWIRSKIR